MSESAASGTMLIPVLIPIRCFPYCGCGGGGGGGWGQAHL